MNQIPAKQNEQVQLERLAAQREIYSFAKRLHLLQIIITVLLPILLFILSSIYNQIIIYTALFGILVFVCDSILIATLIKK